MHRAARLIKTGCCRCRPIAQFGKAISTAPFCAARLVSSIVCLASNEGVGDRHCGTPTATCSSPRQVMKTIGHIKRPRRRALCCGSSSFAEFFSKVTEGHPQTPWPGIVAVQRRYVFHFPACGRVVDEGDAHLRICITMAVRRVAWLGNRRNIESCKSDTGLHGGSASCAACRHSGGKHRATFSGRSGSWPPGLTRNHGLNIRCAA